MTSPWEAPQPPGEPAPMAEAEAAYRAILHALRAHAHENEDLAPATAVMALIDVAVDLMLASGVLWTSPNLTASVRELAAYLERRRTNEPAKPELRTVRETFAAGRAATN